MLRFSWAIALACTLITLTGILIVTRDLAVTDAIFKDGVAQAEKVNATTDDALAATGQLPGADDALVQSMPQVAGVMASLGNAEATLGSLSQKLTALGRTLASADRPLVGIIDAGQTATRRANGAAVPIRHIAGTLGSTRRTVRTIGAHLDDTIRLAREIESKLHILLMLPTLGNAGAGRLR